MSDKKTKIECLLTARGTKGVDESVVDEINVPDPTPEVGKHILSTGTEEGQCGED